MDDGSVPISDDERLYRRVPESRNLYDPNKKSLDSDAFAPHRVHDTDGLSLTRAQFAPIKEAARGHPGKSYFVAELSAGALREHGIEVIPDPKPANPGHVLLPQLNSANRKEDVTQTRKEILRAITLRVHGPFKTPDE